ncbi:MAG: right-handed parallel beta-helix repeat-containing protein, partial [Spirochaetales bacterium]|nr:right-handed parallel beta-helix repeat-containing protein [Spirochaetales bacterium]
GAQFSHSPANIDERSRFYIENIFEELDAPREWYLDSDSGLLYWMPEDGIDPASAVVEVPLLTTLVEIRGTQRKPVSGITFDRIRFAGTRSTFMEPYEIPSLGDWALRRDGAVLMEGTRNCTISNCFFDAVGGNGLFINRYNRDATVTGCTFSESGDSAICLVGEYESTTGTQKPFPFECRVENNHIHHCGEYGKQIAGVYISRAKRVTVGHNLIHDMSRAGICIGDGTWGGHVIEFNHVHDTCRQTHDHGPFNSWGRERYWSLVHSHFGPDKGNCIVAGDVKFDAMETTAIRNNYFVEHKGWGIDLDDGSSNYELYNNICIGVSVKLREGAYRTVRNNIWINPANPSSFHVGNIDNHDRYIHNITVMNPAYSRGEHDFDFKSATTGNEIYAITMPPVNGPWLEEINGNCYWNPSERFVARIRPRGGDPRDIELEEWQAMGFDISSVCADPLFVDPEQGNYHVRADSPALRVGFKNFSIGTWGLTEDFKPW